MSLLSGRNNKKKLIVVKAFNILLGLSFLAGLLFKANSFVEVSNSMQSENITVSAEMVYNAKPNALFAAIEDGTVFKLTGAKEVKSDFREGGKYYLDFGDRNGQHCFIEGEFRKIVPEKVVSLVWNVNGFRAVPDKNTEVTFTIIDLSPDTTKLQITHERIPTQESADGKEKSWNEILSDLKQSWERHLPGG